MKQTYALSQIFEKIKNDIISKNCEVLEIMGPTASGKTRLTVEIAQYLEKKLDLKSEVIVVDSRQIYRNCDISSVKISDPEKMGIPHWGLDLKNLEEEYSVVDFQKYAFEKISEIINRGHFPLLSGGTMLWLDAISENYLFNARKAIKSNKRQDPRWKFLKVGIDWPREVLYERINKRCVELFEQGLIAETEFVLKNFKPCKSAKTSFGYQEIEKYLRGEISYDQALRLNQQRNRNYAKKQITWWRGRKDICWIEGV